MNSEEKEPLEDVREFIYYIEETGQLSGDDIAFLKGSYYDFKNYKKDSH